MTDKKEQKSRLKDIVEEHIYYETGRKKKEKKPKKNRSKRLEALLSKEIESMKASEKTRGAEILKIFARHNFYAAGGFTPVELRTTLEDLGPTYVKIGQIMSSRTDMLPESYCVELVKLRQTVQPLDPEVAKAVIEEETGKKIDEIFSEFRDEPLGSASIAQVHYAVMKDGTKVVVKVQRPLIKELVEKDFVLLKKIGGIANTVVDARDMNTMDLLTVVEELEAVTNDELDFTIEAKNTKFFREHCIEEDTDVSCAEIIDELSTERILTQTYVDGYSISDKDRLIRDGYDVEQLGSGIVTNFIHQVLDVGTFHADPHQGNIMVSGGKAYWIDFGMIGTISEANINMIQEIILGVLQQDAEALASAAMNVGKTTERTDKTKLMDDIDVFLSRFIVGTTSVSEISIDDLLMSFSDLCLANDIALPPEFTMLIRSIIMVEGVIEELCPDLNLFKLFSDRFLERTKKNFDIKQELLKIGEETLSISRKAARLPALCADALRDVVKGNVKIRLELKDREDLVGDVRDIIKNIVLAVFACVLFFGSCVLCLTEIHPVTKSGMPLMALVGFVVSIALAIYTIRRFKKNK